MRMATRTFLAALCFTALVAPALGAETGAKSSAGKQSGKKVILEDARALPGVLWGADKKGYFENSKAIERVEKKMSPEKKAKIEAERKRFKAQVEADQKKDGKKWKGPHMSKRALAKLKEGNKKKSKRLAKALKESTRSPASEELDGDGIPKEISFKKKK